MAEQDSAPVWGHHNLKTAADVARMLKGLPPLTESEGGGVSRLLALAATPGSGVTAWAAIPPAAVSATIETVKSEPLKTTETVQEIPAPPKRSHSKKVS